MPAPSTEHRRQSPSRAALRPLLACALISVSLVAACRSGVWEVLPLSTGAHGDAGPDGGDGDGGGAVGDGFADAAAIPCDPPLVDCAGRCVSLGSDARHCG